MNGISLLIIILTYLWMVFFLSNVSTFWDLFRSKDVNYQENTLAPLSPYLSAIPEATQKDTIDISGQSESGGKVILYVDNTKYDETVSDSAGSFTFTNIAVGLFPRRIYVRALNQDNIESADSNEYTIVKDTEPPELEIIKPEKDSEDYESTGHAYTITGKTEPGTTVYIGEQIAVTNPIGEFSTSLRLESGGNSIKIVALDKAENETEKEIFINFHKID